MNNSFDTSNDLKVADHLISELEVFFYNHSFYFYEDFYWTPHDKDIVKQRILDVLKEKYSQGRSNNILDIIRLSTRKYSWDINLNGQNNLINVQNGMYSLSDNKLIKHSDVTKNYFSTNKFQVKYNSNAQCPRWEKFIEEIFEFDDDKQSKIDLLQEYMGLCLTPNTSFQKSLLLLGNGSNGKSIVLRILEEILGKENYSNIELNQLSNKNYIVELQNKIVNFCSEIDHKGSFSSGVFKRIVTGETLTGDAKFKDPIKFQPYCKLLFATNDLPKTNDTTKGYFRRLMILKFNRSFEGKDKDPLLFEKLIKEINGIFNWILIGLERLLKNQKFSITPSSVQELDDYLESSNSVVSFIREKCEVEKSSTHWEKYNDLYTEYKIYCNDSGLRPFQKSNFKNEIMKHYFGVIEFSKTGTRGWYFKHVKFLNSTI